MSLVQGWGCRGQEVAEPPVDRRRNHHPPPLPLPLHPTLPLTLPHPPTRIAAVSWAQGEPLSHQDSRFGGCWRWCFAFLLCWFSENPDSQHEERISLVCCTSARVPASLPRGLAGTLRSTEGVTQPQSAVTGRGLWPVQAAGQAARWISGAHVGPATQPRNLH